MLKGGWSYLTSWKYKMFLGDFSRALYSQVQATLHIIIPYIVPSMYSINATGSKKNQHLVNWLTGRRVFNFGYTQWKVWNNHNPIDSFKLLLFLKFWLCCLLCSMWSFSSSLHRLIALWHEILVSQKGLNLNPGTGRQIPNHWPRGSPSIGYCFSDKLWN